MASLERLWKEGRDGALSPLEQMRAWALRTAQRDIGGDKAVNLEMHPGLVCKSGCKGTLNARPTVRIVAWKCRGIVVHNVFGTRRPPQDGPSGLGQDGD